MFDEKKEKRLADEWDQGDSKETMTIDDISTLAIHGFGCCKGHCLSRKYSGSERCACIREVFPTPNHFELYQEARNKFLDLLGLGILARTVSQETAGEKKNGKAN